MADAHAKPNHDYHLVNPSPWPLIGSIFAFLTAVGLIMSMKALSIGGLKVGPFILEQLHDLRASGTLLAKDMVLQVGTWDRAIKESHL